MSWLDQAPLRGRTALVTGSTRGIGRASADLLASLGADVAVNGCQSDEAVQEIAAGIADRHQVRTLALPGDVSDPEVVASMYRTLFSEFRQLDVLVNNAGILRDALLGMIGPELVERVLGVNAKGAIYVLQGAARLMTRAGRGSIINVSSIVGVQGNEGQTVYGASKAAVIGLTRSAARELAPKGIRVNAIAPGYIETDMISRLPPEVRALRESQIGLARVGTPDDIARVVAFLATDLSAYVTGQVLGVDGGMHL